MLRYLREAFWARVPLPMLGALPVNALLVLAAGVLGCAEHAVWLLGIGLETAYLYALTTNPRFHKLIATRGAPALPPAPDETAVLRPESRERLANVERKVRAVGAVYGSGELAANPLLQSNLDALIDLVTLFARLLASEQRLAPDAGDVGELDRKRERLRADLAAGGAALTPALRDSKQATMELIEKRLANAQRRAETLAEIASDLTRIETQVDVALEDARLEGKPSSVTANLNLLNQILKSNSSLAGFDVEQLETGRGLRDK